MIPNGVVWLEHTQLHARIHVGYYHKMSLTLLPTKVMVSKMCSRFSKQFILMPMHTEKHIIHYGMSTKYLFLHS